MMSRPRRNRRITAATEVSIVSPDSLNGFANAFARWLANQDPAPPDRAEKRAGTARKKSTGS